MSNLIIEKRKRNIDLAWEEIFKKYNVVETIEKEGKFILTTEQIKNSLSKTYEPRLITKFDTIESLPKIFMNDSEVIYSIVSYQNRDSYCVVKSNLYIDLEIEVGVHQPINYLEFPDYLETLDLNNITSESSAINVANISGMFADFLESNDFVQTVSGRKVSKNWSYLVDTTLKLNDSKKISIDVAASQMEIDASFENKDSFILIEAKNKFLKSLMVRQLYYPFRDFSESIRNKKDIRNIYLAHQNGIYLLIEYIFENFNEMMSIKEKKRKEKEILYI